LAVPDPNALADTTFADAGADLVNDASPVAMRNQPWVSNFPGRSLARFDIGGIDAGGCQLDADFARASMRRFYIADAQDVACGSISFIIDSLHGAPPEPDDSMPQRPDYQALNRKDI
jgi:hypothetical protein